MLFGVTFTLILSIPLGLFVIWLLRSVERVTHELACDERAVVDAIDELEFRLHSPILEEDVARQAHLGLDVTRKYLDRLKHKRVIEWTAVDGFRARRA